MSGLSFPKVGSHDKFMDFRIGKGKIHDFSEEPSVYLPFFEIHAHLLPDMKPERIVK